MIHGTWDEKYRMVTQRLMTMARETEMVTSRPVLRTVLWWPPPPAPSLSTATVDTADTPPFSAPAAGSLSSKTTCPLEDTCCPLTLRQPGGGADGHSGHGSGDPLGLASHLILHDRSEVAGITIYQSN